LTSWHLRAERGLDDPRVQRKLAALRGSGYNFDPERADEFTPERGWHRDDLSASLPPEPPGPPEPDGSWETARRLMRGYEFADPSIVRAYYDPNEPLEGRTMLLELRFRGLLRFDAGTRVTAVYEEDRERDGRWGRVWGWAYRTLEGHLEQGQMDWQVWKWRDSGEVEFRIYSYSRPAPDPNLLIRFGFLLFGRREQVAFQRSTLTRMQRLTRAALQGEGAEPVRREAEAATARRGFATDAAHEDLGRRLDEP
jgi:uncharacterized protein (UPF0548 family)